MRSLAKEWLLDVAALGLGIFVVCVVLLNLYVSVSAGAVNASPDVVNTSLNASYNFSWNNVSNISFNDVSYYNGSWGLGNLTGYMGDVFIRGVISGDSAMPYQPSASAGIIVLLVVMAGIIMTGGPKDLAFPVVGGFAVMLSEYLFPEWIGLVIMMVVGISVGVLMLRINRGS